MSKLPFMKFFPADWQTEPTLRMCSLGARGLWIELLCLMHTGEPYGYLTVSGRPVTDTQLALLVSAPENEVLVLLRELEDAGVFHRNKKGVITSRRLIRDGRLRAEAQRNGAKGGNPNLRKEREKKTTLKGEDKGRVKPSLKPRGQSPEDREKKRAKARPVEGEVAEALDAVWTAWSVKGRQRSASRARVAEALVRAGKIAPLADIVAAAKRYAGQTDPAYHKGLDAWLVQERFANWMVGERASEPPPTTEDWARALHEFDVNGRAGWNHARFGPSPDESGFRGVKG